MGHVGPLALLLQDGAAGGGGRPLGRGGPLAAVGHRHTVLPLGGAEVGGGHGRRPAGKAAVNKQRRQGQGLPHGGAGAVQPVEGNAEVPQAEGGAHALVQKVSRQNIVQVSGLEARLIQSAAQSPLLHGGLRFFPGRLSEKGILAQLVKAAAKGALALEFPADAGAGADGGGMGQGHGPAAHTLQIHIATSQRDFP